MKMTHLPTGYSSVDGVTQEPGVMGTFKQKVKDFFLKLEDWDEIDSDIDTDEEDEATEAKKKSPLDNVYNTLMGANAIGVPRTTRSNDFLSRMRSKHNHFEASKYFDSPSFRAGLAGAAALNSGIPPINYRRRSSIALTK